MTLLDAATVDRITADAREVDVRRALLTAIAAVFYALGWLAGAAVRSLIFTVAAIRLGYTDARRGTRGAGSRRGRDGS